MGTQKNRLCETVLLSTKKNMFELMGKEINAKLGAQDLCEGKIYHQTSYCRFETEKVGLHFIQ